MGTHDRMFREGGAVEREAGGEAPSAGMDFVRLRTMQQRWVQRKAREVSEPSEAPEQEADAVADHVADELHGGGGEAAPGKKIARDTTPHIGAAAPGVGRKIFRSPAKHGAQPKHDAAAKQGAAKDGANQEGAVDPSDADAVLRVMDDILAGNGSRLIGDAPSKWQPTLKLLSQMVNRMDMDGNRRRSVFDEVSRELAPVLAHAPESDYAGNVVDKMHELRTSVLESEAIARVAHTVVVDNGGKKEAVELGAAEGNPRAEGLVLGTTLPKLVETINTSLERAKNAGTLAGIDKEKLEKLETMGHVLTLASGWLKLSDEEFAKELSHIKGVMNGVATYAELVKTVLDMGSAAVSLTCTLSGALMRAVGEHAMAETCEHVGSAVSGSVGKVVSAIEIVHGLAVAADPTASRDARIGGGVEAASGIASFAVGAAVKSEAIAAGATATEATAAAGAAGTAATLPIMGPYLLLKTAQQLYSEATLGFEAGFLREVFDYMQESAGAISGGANGLIASKLLQQSETDPEKRAALVSVEKWQVAALAMTLDSFLDRCAKTGADHGLGNEFIDRYPGNYTILAEAFTGPVQHRGAKSLEEVSALADMTMKKIAWCFHHGAAIVKASATHKHVEDVQDIQDEMDAKKKEEEKD